MASYIYCSTSVTQVLQPDGSILWYCFPTYDGYETTLGNILFENQDVYVPFDFTQLNPAVATDMFTAGFILALAPIATAFGLSKLISLLK